MSRTINDETLARLCAPCPSGEKVLRAARAAGGLGELGRWWLSEEALRQACRAAPHLKDALDQPTLSREHGACWVAFVNERMEQQPLLGEAFLLPLRWERDARPCPRLPPALAALAREVLRALQQDRVPGLGGRGWGLRLDLADDPDLSGLTLQCGSGWAALAAGLVLAAEGGLPNPDVWATGVWDSRGGFRPVDGLTEKLRLAARYRVRTFFVPSDQAAAAGKTIAELGLGLEVRPLDMNQRGPREALEPYIARLFGRPGWEAPPEARRSYYLHMARTDRGTARGYYLEYLLGEVAEHSHQRLLAREGAWCPTHLVSVVSDSWEQVPQAVLTVRPDHCLILYTPDKADELRLALGELQRVAPECEARPGEFTVGEDLLGQLAERVRRFADGVPAPDLVLDVTPATKEMSLVLTLTARPGNRLLYVRHDLARGVVVPGSQDPLVYTSPGLAY